HSLLAKVPREHALLSETWNAFAETHGAVFVCRDKILRWDGATFHVWPFAGGRRLLAARCGGTIYVQHQPTGLYALGADGPRLVIPATLLGNADVYWMEDRGTGWLL